MLFVWCAVCAAAVDGYDLESVMSGILTVETGGQQFAINDNTTRRSYKLSSLDEAVTTANYLMSLDHNIDMGKFQINSIQMSRGWSVTNLFDAAFNQTAAETIFNEWLAKAQKLYGDSVLAWQRAIGGYNAGFAGLKNGNPSYVTKVLRAMGVKTASLDRGELGQHGKAVPDATVQAALGTLDEKGDDAEDDDDFGLPAEPKAPVDRAQAVDVALMAALSALLILALKFIGPVAVRLAIRAMLSGTRKAIKTAQDAVK
jgi:hypothetical protein